MKETQDWSKRKDVVLKFVRVMLAHLLSFSPPLPKAQANKEFVLKFWLSPSVRAIKKTVFPI